MSFHQILIPCLICLSSFAFSDDAKTDKYDVMEQTQKNFQDFKTHLKWYFSYLDQSAKKEQKNAYGRHLIKNKEELKKAIQDSNEIFLNLRKKLRDIALAKYGNYPDTNTEVIAIDAEVTGWYTTYLEAILFPEDWEKDFQHSLEAKK